MWFVAWQRQQSLQHTTSLYWWLLLLLLLLRDAAGPQQHGVVCVLLLLGLLLRLNLQGLLQRGEASLFSRHRPQGF
jgi:hypothetical protein